MDFKYWLLVILLIWAGYNAQEAHTHSHEAACAAGHDPACHFAR